MQLGWARLLEDDSVEYLDTLRHVRDLEGRAVSNADRLDRATLHAWGYVPVLAEYEAGERHELVALPDQLAADGQALIRRFVQPTVNSTEHQRQVQTERFNQLQARLLAGVHLHERQWPLTDAAQERYHRAMVQVLAGATQVQLYVDQQLLELSAVEYREVFLDLVAATQQLHREYA